MLQEMATITQFQKLLSANETLPQAIAVCQSMGANYVEALKAIMKRPQVVSEEDAKVMTELLLYQHGNHRLPAISGYMRERYLHRERWIGALKQTKAPVQFVWADGDPIANVGLGRALSKEVPQARYTEVAGLGHFLLMEDPAAIASHIRRFIEPA